MPEKSAIYFASDFHLGIPDYESSLKRERKIIRWLELVQKDAVAIYLMGDVFDFWFEYKHVVPKYFVRLLGKLAELTDKGIRIEMFTGNHDMWAFDYLSKEIGITIHRSPVFVDLQGKKLLLGHGDGLGPGDYGYKFIKKIFANRTCQWLFARLHPNLAMGMANFWSGKSRKANPEKEVFESEDKEWLHIYSKQQLALQPQLDYFIFGHRHLPLDLKVGEKARYVNLGDWFNWCSYAELRGGNLQLKYFDEDSFQN
jgi:UDP-2,3-diacylglucosamine hydrolase